MYILSLQSNRKKKAVWNPTGFLTLLQFARSCNICKACEDPKSVLGVSGASAPLGL